MPISCIIGMHFANYLIRCLADPKLNFEQKYELFSLIFFCELQPKSREKSSPFGQYAKEKLKVHPE